MTTDRLLRASVTVDLKLASKSFRKPMWQNVASTKKEGKVNAENRKFNSSWTQKCVDIETAEGKLICLLCNVCKGLQPAKGTSPRRLSICLR